MLSPGGNKKQTQFLLALLLPFQALISPCRHQHHRFPQGFPLFRYRRPAAPKTFFFSRPPTPTHSLLSLKKKQNPIQPSRLLPINSSPNPLRQRTRPQPRTEGRQPRHAGAGPPRSQPPGYSSPLTARGFSPSLAGPLQGSDQQLVTLLGGNRRHLGSLKEQ